MDNPKLVIAIDFGTTFSGAAFAFPDTHHDTVFPVLRWPNSMGGHKRGDKVPTKLRYLRRGDPEWGFLIPPDTHEDEVLDLIKLCVVLFYTSL